MSAPVPLDPFWYDRGESGVQVDPDQVIVWYSRSEYDGDEELITTTSYFFNLVSVETEVEGY